MYVGAIAGYGDFLFVYTVSYINGNGLFAECGYGVDGPLQGEEVATAVLGHDKVVAADVGCEFGYFLFDGVDCHAGYDASAFDTEVGVVFTAFGYGGAGAGAIHR